MRHGPRPIVDRDRAAAAVIPRDGRGRERGLDLGHRVGGRIRPDAARASRRRFDARRARQVDVDGAVAVRQAVAGHAVRIAGNRLAARGVRLTAGSRVMAPPAAGRRPQAGERLMPAPAARLCYKFPSATPTDAARHREATGAVGDDRVAGAPRQSPHFRGDEEARARGDARDQLRAQPAGPGARHRPIQPDRRHRPQQLGPLLRRGDPRDRGRGQRARLPRPAVQRFVPDGDLHGARPRHAPAAHEGDRGGAAVPQREAAAAPVLAGAGQEPTSRWC